MEIFQTIIHSKKAAANICQREKSSKILCVCKQGWKFCAATKTFTFPEWNRATLAGYWSQLCIFSFCFCYRQAGSVFFHSYMGCHKPANGEWLCTLFIRTYNLSPSFCISVFFFLRSEYECVRICCMLLILLPCFQRRNIPA